MQTIKLLVLVAVATILSACNNGSAPDTIAPVISLSGAGTVTVEAGSVYTDAGASALDNADGNITTSIATVNPVNAAVVGSYTVTYNVSDLAGNAATQVTRTVNVVDTTAPVITLSGATSVSIYVDSTYTDAGATAADSLNGNITINIVVVGDVVDTTAPGTYTVTYNVSDANGNAATEVTRTVNVVTPPVPDGTAPVITLSGTTPVSVSVGDTYSDAGATALDNVDGNITGKIVTLNLVDTTVVGTYSVTYNVSDAAGNAAAPVTRVVTVVDNTAPVITLLGGTPVTVEAGSAYSDAGATALDNVDGNITASIVTINPVNININVVGAYLVTYNVVDTVGNNAVEVTRTVNVVDTTLPVITLLGGTPVSVEGNSTYTDTGASASDNVDGDITASIVSTANLVNTGTLGSYTVTYNVSDANGNAATEVTRTVNVVDTTAPVITLQGSGMVNISVGATYTDAGATASDNFDGDISGSIVVAGNTVDTANAGTYVITYNVSDAAGNGAAQVTRTVNVSVVVGVVTPYYTAAPNWNDYVKNDLNTQFDATNTPADGAETGGYSALIHGGEMRSVNIGVTNCTDQAATDALGAFNWVCDDSSGSALMVSTGLKKDKNLADLLDFATQVWKNNSVTVTGTGSLTTASSAWWSNPVTLANAGGSLATAGSVYLITANPAAAYTVDASKIALIIQPGVTVFGPATNKNIIFTDTQSYLWFEGTIDVTGDYYGFYLSTVSFSVLRNLSISNAVYDGINLNTNSVNNILSNITSSNHTVFAGGSGIEINGSSNNTLSNIIAANNANRGVQIISSSNNTLSNINVFNNGQVGFEIVGIISGASNNVVTNLRAVRQGWLGVNISGDNNLLSNLTVSENGTGISVSGAYNNTFLNVTASNNWTYGLEINGVNTILSNITVTNTQSVGIQVGSLNNSVSNLAAVNNKYIGIRAVTFGDNHHFSNITAVNNGRGIGFFNGAKNNIFTGLLKVGGNSVVDCGDDSATTFSDASCIAVAPSDFTLISGATAADSFVAKVTTDDTANTSDTNGTASFPADITAFDWFNFDNIFRAWGNDGSAFPNVDNANAYINKWAGDSGRIWDWSLANNDTGDAGNPVLQNVLTLPSNGNAANTIEHVWSGTAADQAACSALVPSSVFNAVDDCRSTYLRNASEIVGDNIGNDNGLCETDETCLYTPNIGSYQGHGGLISAGVFTDGDTLTGITLMKYTTNGY